MSGLMRHASRETAIRQLTSRDLPSLTALSATAGWNQTGADWMLLLRLNPEGCLGIECNGHIVATTTLVCYEDRLAWLGMVLTQPEFRNRGFARSLVARALELAEAGKKIRTVKLDATDEGRPIY
jgi:GNAT superfamily N-acetyltransferase